MSAGNTLPKTPSSQSQPGQRALRLVDVATQTPPIPSAPPTSAPSPSPTLRRLQRDLEAARAEAQSLHDLLEQLPEILERKFQLRLAALLAEQRQLQRDNALLQQHLLAPHDGAFIGTEGGPDRGAERSRLALSALPPAADTFISTATARAAHTTEPPLTQGLGLRRALRHLHLPER